MKTEDLDADDYFHPTGVCSAAGCQKLRQDVAKIAPHSDVEMKRAQRADVMDRIDAVLQRQPAGQPANVYLFDDWLPTSHNADHWTLFADELQRRFGPDRVRIWAPNLKSEIVDAHRAVADGNGCPPGWITATCGCWHTFNERWADGIRAAGGLDVVFADCFRGFERGCGALVDDLLRRRLFRRGRCGLTFAVSDRSERSQGWSAAAAALQVSIDLSALFAGPECTYAGRVLSHRAYGRTMHYFTAEVHERTWIPEVAGFLSRVEHRQMP